MAAAVNRQRAAFALVSSLFFAWGFITSNNDPLIVALRSAFHLNYTEALLTQLIFFVAFGTMSLPAAWLAQRQGPVTTIQVALAAMIAGCLLVRAASGLGGFAPILAALFVLAAGVATLQVAANPLAANLGPPERSHFRLTLAQSLNSLGVVAGVQFGAAVMLGPLSRTDVVLDRATTLGFVEHAFTAMALLLVVLLSAMLIFARPLRAATAGTAPADRASVFGALRSRWAVGGAVAIAAYVGAEVSIGSLMINFLAQPTTLGLSFEEGGRLLASLYWGGALAGRLAGTLLLSRVAAPRLLSACAALAAFLCALAFGASGPVAGYAALAVGFANSIMFPTIFTLTLERSSASSESTSGLLCVAIVSGAIVPMLCGRIADVAGIATAFLVPLLAYAGIGLFALIAARSRIRREAGELPLLEVT